MGDSYALVADNEGGSLLHDLDCPEVNARRDEGFAVLRLIDCQNTPPEHLIRHDCLRRLT
jgi:hypothetical protein